MQSKVVPRAFVLMTVLFYFKEEMMENSIIWIFFAGVCIVWLYFVSGKMKVQQKQRIEYEENRVKYRNFTSEMLDEIPDDKLIQAIIFHIMAKEDKLYEGEEIDGSLKDVLTHGELLIYTIYQVEASMKGNQGSIHTFFIQEPYCTYRPYVKEAFEAVGCHDIVGLMEAAEKLAVMIENDEDTEIDDRSDYGKYNFADFTNELMSMLKASDIDLKIGKYIRENKYDFIDMEVKTDE